MNELRTKVSTKTTDSVRVPRSGEEILRERYRCPSVIAKFAIGGELSSNPGYFHFGPGLTCFGRCSTVTPAKRPYDTLPDVTKDLIFDHRLVQLPFEAEEIIDSLRAERYAGPSNPQILRVMRRVYYGMRPFLGAARVALQQLFFRGWRKIAFPSWPVDSTVESIFEQLLLAAMKASGIRRLPFVWFWPDGARTCTIMTHDVETEAGLEFCRQLIQLDKSFAIPASYQIVPEQRYTVTSAFLSLLRSEGVEINIQDLNHDGLLFSEREEFLRRAERINRYTRRFGASGFRSAIMYRNVDWLEALNVSYDMSVPNVAHLDPQRGGCCTVLPYFIGKILELPVTTTQDYTLFRILKCDALKFWREQISLIRAKHGLISFIVHPDYLVDKDARRVYIELLRDLSELRRRGETWIAPPREVAAWWRLRSELKVVASEGGWRIEGPGSDRAQLAFAVADNEQIHYELFGTQVYRVPRAVNR